MYRLMEYAAVKTALLLITGFIIGRVCTVPLLPLLLAVSLSFAAVLFLLHNSREEYAQYVLPFLILFSAIFMYEVREELKPASEFGENIRRGITVVGTVEEVSLRTDELQCVLQAEYYVTVDSVITSGSRLLLHVRDENKDALRQIIGSIGPGDRAAVKGSMLKPGPAQYPGAFNAQDYLTSKNITASFYAFDAVDITILSDTPAFPSAMINHIRQSIAAVIDKYYGTQAAAMLRALLLADRSMMERESKETFIHAGVMHVLAVSGLHVGMIILILTVVFQRIPLQYRLIAIVIGLLAFYLLTNSPPSVFRASVMAVVYIAALYWNRDANKYNALAVAAILILLVNPEDLFHPGFQLSFAAVLGILFGLEWFEKFEIKKKRNERLLLFLVVSLSAQLATLPLTAYYFGKVSITALPAGFIAIPAAGALLGNGILTLGLSLVSNTAAEITASAGEFIVAGLTGFVTFVSLLPFAYITTPLTTKAQVLLFYIFAAILLFARKNMERLSSRLMLFLFGMLILFTGWQITSSGITERGGLSVFFADVDQGDAALLQLPDNKVILIDAGPASENFDSGRDVIIPLLNNLGIKTIDAVFLSHIDIDHYGGLYTLMEEGYVKEVYKPAADTSNKNDLMLEQIIAGHNIPFYYLTDTVWQWGGTAFISAVDTREPVYDYLTDNDGSAVLKVIYGETSLLFTGDIEKAGEQLLLNRYGSFLSADVLKVSHHGSGGSSHRTFLQTISPTIAVISAGRYNRLNHPAEETLERLGEISCTVYRTDREGTVILRSDGEQWKKIDWQ